MSNTPFGFSNSDDDRSGGSGGPGRGGSGGSGGPGGPAGGRPGDPNDPNDPLAAMLGALGGAGGGTPDLGRMLQQIGQMLQWQGGPVNWNLAGQQARGVVSAAGDRSVGAAERRDVEDAFRLGDTWLNEATVFAAGASAPRTWSRAEWVEGTLDGWKSLIEPVAARIAASMQSALPEEVAEAAGPLVGMMQQVGVSMWGAQVGQSIGTLAGEVCGTTDIGIPLVAGHGALLPANVRAFGEGLGVEDRDVMLYLALREAAHLRLYAHAPWLRAHVQSLVEEYARHVSVDTSGLEETMRTLDPSNPEALNEAMAGGMFTLTVTPAQQAALDRLELVLALVEGWVDDVVTQATDGRLPSAGALREMVRRRRAAGGPAEQTFATLVGLTLRPRRLREASAFWARVRDERGTDGRDAIWSSQDLMPRADDLTDPSVYLKAAAFDFSALEAELGFSGLETGEAAGDGAAEGDDDGPDDPSGPTPTGQG